jgi:hypothetical protein
MIVGNSKKFKGTGCVCFLDVLGFSEDILKNWDSTDNNPLDKILSIKNGMPTLAHDIADDGSETHRIYVSRVSTISDSVTVCFGYEDKPIIGDLVLGIEVILAEVFHIWREIISHGYTIRGAIDFGKIYWDENELIGPALINAYRLESQVAKNSRVIISSELNKVLSTLEQRYSSTLTEHLLKSFRKDIDGYIILNPCNIYRDETERSSILANLLTMRDSLPKGILREKYNPLISMLSSEVVSITEGQLGGY